MKYIRYLLIIVGIILLIIPTSYSYENKECLLVDYPKDINSFNLINYVNRDYPIIKMCHDKYCYYTKTYNHDREVKRFINDYLDTLDNEAYEKALTKGFEITEINYDLCN